MHHYKKISQHWLTNWSIWPKFSDCVYFQGMDLQIKNIWSTPFWIVLTVCRWYFYACDYFTIPLSFARQLCRILFMLVCIFMWEVRVLIIISSKTVSQWFFTRLWEDWTVFQADSFCDFSSYIIFFIGAELWSWLIIVLILLSLR